MDGKIVSIISAPVGMYAMYKVNDEPDAKFRDVHLWGLTEHNEVFGLVPADDGSGLVYASVYPNFKRYGTRKS